MNQILRDFKIKIDSGITRHSRGIWRGKVMAAIRGMNEGDSFTVPTHNAYQQTIVIAKDIGAKMSGCRIKGEDGYRVWLDESPSK